MQFTHESQGLAVEIAIDFCYDGLKTELEKLMINMPSKIVSIFTSVSPISYKLAWVLHEQRLLYYYSNGFQI